MESNRSPMPKFLSLRVIKDAGKDSEISFEAVLVVQNIIGSAEEIIAMLLEAELSGVLPRDGAQVRVHLHILT